MTGKRFWRTLWVVGLLLGFGLIAEQAEACVVTYTAYWVVNGQVAADGFVEDYFDSGSCYYDAYSQWYYWEHSYDAYVSVDGPLCGDADHDWLYNIPYGGGFGYAYVSVPTTSVIWASIRSRLP